MGRLLVCLITPSPAALLTNTREGGEGGGGDDDVINPRIKVPLPRPIFSFYRSFIHLKGATTTDWDRPPLYSPSIE